MRKIFDGNYFQLDPGQFMCQYEAHCIPQCFCCDFFACDCRMQCPEVNMINLVKPLSLHSNIQPVKIKLVSLHFHYQPISDNSDSLTEILERWLNIPNSNEYSKFVYVDCCFIPSCHWVLGAWGDNVLMFGIKNILTHFNTENISSSYQSHDLKLLFLKETYVWCRRSDKLCWTF